MLAIQRNGICVRETFVEVAHEHKYESKGTLCISHYLHFFFLRIFTICGCVFSTYVRCAVDDHCWIDYNMYIMN